MKRHKDGEEKKDEGGASMMELASESSGNVAAQRGRGRGRRRGRGRGVSGLGRVAGAAAAKARGRLKGLNKGARRPMGVGSSSVGACTTHAEIGSNAPWAKKVGFPRKGYWRCIAPFVPYSEGPNKPPLKRGAHFHKIFVAKDVKGGWVQVTKKYWLPAPKLEKLNIAAARRYNCNGGFKGLDALKQELRKSERGGSLSKFEFFAKKKQWKKIHQLHYDWWMFPYDLISSKQYAYVVMMGDVEVLKQDAEYMRDYRRGVCLVAMAWGWDVENGKPLVKGDPGYHPSMGWTNWTIRLYKMLRSLWMFGQNDYFDSMMKYVAILEKKGQLQKKYKNDAMAFDMVL